MLSLLWSPVTVEHCSVSSLYHGIIESSGLRETFKVIQSNCLLSTATVTLQPHHPVPVRHLLNTKYHMCVIVFICCFLFFGTDSCLHCFDLVYVIISVFCLASAMSLYNCLAALIGEIPFGQCRYCAPFTY